MRASDRRGDAGQAVVLVLVVAVMVVLCGVAMGRFAVRVVAVEQAQVAADAAALAAVDGGGPAAAAMAERNGGQLAAYRTRGDAVEVTVVVDGARATARATRAP
ncbi:MAG: hypothetical protein RL238_1934 [Actinomycetota bacterium]|jgi:hypothetical protein